MFFRVRTHPQIKILQQPSERVKALLLTPPKRFLARLRNSRNFKRNIRNFKLRLHLCLDGCKQLYVKSLATNHLQNPNSVFKLQQLLPNNYQILGQFVDVLPCEEPSPVYPFAGFVINLNVATRVHRDYKDNNICVVISMSDGVGGELCLLELGLVVEMRSGDAIIFKSSQLTHFNMHYRGQRASLVFHSDKMAAKWVEDRNGWQHNIFMKTYQPTELDFCL